MTVLILHDGLSDVWPTKEMDINHCSTMVRVSIPAFPLMVSALLSSHFCVSTESVPGATFFGSYYIKCVQKDVILS